MSADEAAWEILAAASPTDQARGKAGCPDKKKISWVLLCLKQHRGCEALMSRGICKKT